VPSESPSPNGRFEHEYYPSGSIEWAISAPSPFSNLLKSVAEGREPSGLTVNPLLLPGGLRRSSHIFNRLLIPVVHKQTWQTRAFDKSFS